MLVGLVGCAGRLIACGSVIMCLIASGWQEEFYQDQYEVADWCQRSSNLTCHNPNP